jgi:uncharacterized damage-inducible protein DinB
MQDRKPARLAIRIARTVSGPMWHGPALAQVLEGVSPVEAAARPLPGAHTIWEIVFHVTAWAEIARARIHGDRIGDPASAEDWPPVLETGEIAWQSALERLRSSHEALAADVRHLASEAIDAKVAGLDYSVSTLLHGVIEHGAYHGGQIRLLAKAAGGSGR